MTEKPFDELLAEAQHSALKLELRDAYLLTDPAFEDWQADRPLSEVAAHYAEWSAIARRTVARGVDLRRVRVVSDPPSDYIRFEHAVTDAVNTSAGERIRWLARSKAGALVLPANDFWLIDDRLVMWLYFSGDGDLTGSATTDDPAVVKVCKDSFATAWEAGGEATDLGL